MGLQADHKTVINKMVEMQIQGTLFAYEKQF